MTDLPEEAMQAALDAIKEDTGIDWSEDPATVAMTRLVVTAAAPFIRADERRRIAGEILGQRLTSPDLSDSAAPMYNAALEEAALLAERGAQ